MKKLDNEINDAAEIILRKAKNFTYQTLLITEENLKKEIKDFYKKINEVTTNIKNISPKIDQYEGQIVVVSREIDEWEKKEKNKIEKEKNLQLRPYPDPGLLSGRNILALLISIPLAIFFGQFDKNGVFVILFIPAPFLLLRFLICRMLKNSDEVEINKWFKEKDLMQNKIDNYFVPSKNFLDKQKLLNDYKNILPKAKKVRSKLYSQINSIRLTVLVYKKALQKLEPMKRNAKEKERTAKINAFERKNRSGAQLIKDKLLKLVKFKDGWVCCYCNENTDISQSEADHIHPVNKGGLTTLHNMVLICKDCNSKKTNLTLRRFCSKYEFDFNDVCERLEAQGKDV
jgi:5-methylcytosine-specific restriction endonuclease McrA